MGTIITILTLIASYFMYKKMGREGWEAFIPFYNTYVLFDELYGEGWRFLTLLVPFYNIYVYIKLNIDIAKKFNQSGAFAAGLILVPTIFYLILGFSNKIQCDGIEVNPVEDIKDTFQ